MIYTSNSKRKVQTNNREENKEKKGEKKNSSEKTFTTVVIDETSGWEYRRRRMQAEVGRDGDSELLMSDVISEMLVRAVSPKTRPIRSTAALLGLHKTVIRRPCDVLR